MSWITEINELFHGILIIEMHLYVCYTSNMTRETSEWEFSSKFDQTHTTCDFLMILKILISRLRCVLIKVRTKLCRKVYLVSQIWGSLAYNNRFWKGVFWFEPFQFNWVTKEWPVNVSILLVALQGCLHKTCMGPKVQKLLWARTGWPTLGHYGINVGCPMLTERLRWAKAVGLAWASPHWACLGLVWAGPSPLCPQKASMGPAGACLQGDLCKAND